MFVTARRWKRANYIHIDVLETSGGQSIWLEFTEVLSVNFVSVTSSTLANPSFDVFLHVKPNKLLRNQPNCRFNPRVTLRMEFVKHIFTKGNRYYRMNSTG